MFKQISYILFFAVAVWACKQDAPATTAKSVVITSKTFEKTDGQCPDKCASFKATYPEVTTGSPALKKAVEDWAFATLRDHAIASETPLSAPMTPDAIANAFIESWKENNDAIPEFARSFELDGVDTVLCNSAKALSLRMDIYHSAGGAHPNYFSSFVSFDPATGQVLPFGKVVTNPAAILPLLDKKYRVLKQEAFDNGFVYEGGALTMPQNWAYTENGLLFHYNAYEIAAYAIGDADIFLTWEEMGAAAKRLMVRE